MIAGRARRWLPLLTVPALCLPSACGTEQTPRAADPDGQTVHFDLLDLLGDDLASVIDLNRQIRIRTGCAAHRSTAEVPRGRTVTPSGPACLPVEKGKVPEEAVFHFGTTPNGPQMVVNVPLAPEAQRRLN